MPNTISDWMRIDLHIHTSKSRDTKENDYAGEFTVDVLRTKLKENSVQLFSLTDHNIINTQAYIDYVAGYQDGDPFPLLGVELDVRHTNDRVYHALIIFKNNITAPNSTFVTEISGILESLYVGQDMKSRETTFANIMDKFYKYEFVFILHGEGDNSISRVIRGRPTDGAAVDNLVIVYEHLGIEKVKEETINYWNENLTKSMSDGLDPEDYIPYLSFSDNHNIAQYPRIHKADTDAKREHSFIYIKGIPNYESLRLAFVDPTIRIKSEAEITAIKADVDSRGYIQALKLENVKLDDESRATSIQDIDITFSPHFNAIIGGSSSGKSLLSEIIRQKISGLQNNTDASEKYKLCTNSVSKIKKYRDAEWDNEAAIDNDKIVYLSQGQIIDYFYKGNMAVFAEKANKMTEYNTAKSSFTEKKSAIQQVVQDFSGKYESAIAAKQKFSSCKISQTDIEMKYGSAWSFTPVDCGTWTPNHAHKLENITKLETEIPVFKSFWELTDEELATVQAFELLVAQKKGIITKEDKILQKRQTFIRSVETIITNANAQAITDNLSTQATAKNAATGRIDSVVTTAADIFSQFWGLKQSAKQAYNTPLSHKEIIQITDDVNIGIESKSEFASLADAILKKVITVDATTDNLYMAIYGNHDINRQGARNGITFQTKINNILQAECYNALGSPVDFLIYKNQGNSESTHNSPGRNCEYYLKTIFDNDNIKTIIIDQPEDNLGTTFISEDDDGLIELIRKYKFKKQIFLVTHNASIVVYGDAENTILAQNLENTITYEQIRMEDGEHAMKKICDNLDGGKKVFENRRRKYNHKKMNQGQA